MNHRVVLLADVAVLRLADFAELRIAVHIHLFEVQRRERTRRRENLFLPQLANARLGKLALVARELLGFALARLCFHEATAFAQVRAKKLRPPTARAAYERPQAVRRAAPGHRQPAPAARRPL
jgi:hypothetical protein